MSYWIYLNYDDDRECLVSNHAEGGTVAIGGTDEAQLNVTYNYSECYRIVSETPHALLHGKIASETIPALKQMVERLGTKQYRPDYWAPTPGNAGHALNILLGWAEQHPEARWSVS